MAPAQNSTSSVPLGDLARQLKAQRAKSEEKSKVFTNDDLATLSPSPEKSSTTTTTKEAKPGKSPSRRVARRKPKRNPRKRPRLKRVRKRTGKSIFTIT